MRRGSRRLKSVALENSPGIRHHISTLKELINISSPLLVTNTLPSSVEITNAYQNVRKSYSKFVITFVDRCMAGVFCQIIITL
jgi:hypothetical protein